KPVHRRSVWAAYQDYGVHLLPSTISMVLIFVNIEGYYVGLQPNIVVLQIAGKIQELLIISSLTTLIAHRLRNEVINIDGSLIGLPGVINMDGSIKISPSGDRDVLSQFIINSFVSAKIRLDMGFVRLLLASVILAVASGPAVAILLYPKSREWPAGGSMYWIGGTSDDLWPSQVGLEHYMPEKGHLSDFSVSCTSKNAYQNSLCPSGGYLELMHRYTSSWYPWPTVNIGEYLHMDPSHAALAIPIYGPHEQEARYATIAKWQADSSSEYSIFAIHRAAAWVVSKLRTDWYNASHSAPRLSVTSQYKLHSKMKSTVWTQLPVVGVQCSPPKFFTQNQRKVAFPSLSRSGLARELSSGWDLHRVALVHNVLDDLTFSAYPRVFNIDLSAEPWTNVTTGIIIESPWTNKTARTASLCVVDTHWASGTVTLTTDVVPSTSHSLTSEFDDYYFLYDDVFAPSAGSEWRRLNTTDDWLDALNFQLPDEIRGLNPSNTTAIEALVMALGIEYENASTAVAYEHLLATMYVDALARVGSWRIPDIENSNAHRKKDWKSKLLRGEEAFQGPAGAHNSFTGFKTSQTITGYAYHVNTSVSLSIVVLVFYLLIALEFTVRSLVKTR
ncbi:hypothetical protein K505DRAFT_223079, partial [Melanomma pulvis-pyrius CBS 109.77]